MNKDLMEKIQACKHCGKPINKGRVCVDCKKLYQRNYFSHHSAELSSSASSRKRALLDWYRKLKEGKPCNICGGVFKSVCLDYDHLPGHAKVLEVSKMVRLGYAKEKIEVEISKCQLLCANCHRVLTLERRYGRKHLSNK